MWLPENSILQGFSGMKRVVKKEASTNKKLDGKRTLGRKTEMAWFQRCPLRLVSSVFY